MSPLNQGKTKLKIYMASTSIRTGRKRLTHLYKQDQLERSRRPCDYNLQASQDARTHALKKLMLSIICPHYRKQQKKIIKEKSLSMRKKVPKHIAESEKLISNKTMDVSTNDPMRLSEIQYLSMLFVLFR